VITEERLQEIREIVNTPQAWTRDIERKLVCELLAEVDLMHSNKHAADELERLLRLLELGGRPDATGLEGIRRRAGLGPRGDASEDAVTEAETRLSWGMMMQPDVQLTIHLGPPSFAERVLLEFQEARGLELDYGAGDQRILNGDRVPDGHHYAIIDAEGETLSTGPTQESAIEVAAREEIRAMDRSVSMAEYRSKRVMAAFETIETGGAE